MSRDGHAVHLIELWQPKRGQNITRALINLPQVWISGGSISARQQSLQCGQNLRLFWELHCRWQLDCTLEQWRSTEDKSVQNSTTEVSFCTIIICLSQCTTAIIV